MIRNFTLTAVGSLFVAATAIASPNAARTMRTDLPAPSTKLELQRPGEKLSAVQSESRKHGMRPAKRAAQTTPVIYNAEGISKIYEKDCSGIAYNPLYGGLFLYEQTVPAEIIYGENNEVYIKNILSYADYGTYVKGTIDGDVITLPLPQTVMFYEDDPNYGDYGVNLSVVAIEVYEENGGTTIDCVPQNISSVTMTVMEDGTLVLDIPGEFNGEDFPEYGLGLNYTDDDSWNGFVDFYQVYSPVNAIVNKMPADAEIEEYAFIRGDYGYKVNVAFDNGVVYFQGLSEQMPDGVLIGYVQENTESIKVPEGFTNPWVGEALPGDGKLIRIPQNQFVGIYASTYFIYSKVAFDNVNYASEEDPSIVLGPDSYDYYLYFNPETKTFSTVVVPPTDPSEPQINTYLLLNASLDTVYYLEAYGSDFKLQYQDDFAGVPMNPNNLEFGSPFLEDYGYNSFFFNIPVISTEGRMLNAENVYYRVYIDDEPLVFEETEGPNLLNEETILYYGVTEPTDILPIWFENGWDIYKWDATFIEIGIYVEGIETLGVQTVYINDEVTTESEIVTIDAETNEIVSNGSTGIDSISGDVISTEYFNLNGQRINNPENGIFVKRSVLSDGTVIVKKVARK